MRRGPVKQRAETLEHRAGAGDRPRVEQRQQELGVVGLELAEIIDVAHLVADDDAEVPERVQEAADEALLRRPDAVAEQQQQIDVGVETEVAAPVAAERDDRHRSVIGAGVGDQLPDERVDAVRVPFHRAAPAGAVRDRRAQLLPGGVERRLQRRFPRRRANARRLGAGGIRLRYRHAGDIPGFAGTII